MKKCTCNVPEPEEINGIVKCMDCGKPIMKVIELPTYIEECDGYLYDDIVQFFGDKGNEFQNWFAGKTGGMTKDGKYCVYKYDFDKFCRYIGLSIG